MTNGKDAIMKLYYFFVFLFKVVVYLINGKPQLVGRENLPKNEPFILAATHRSYWDPVMLAVALHPLPLAFMAKESLFKIPILGWLLKKAGMFPVNREKPSTKTIRTSITMMDDGRILGIFPSGTRHSTEIKGGTAMIHRMSQRAIVPVAIQPPIGFWQTIRRKKAKIAVGKPIEYQPEIKYDREKLKEIDSAIATAFDQLDKELDPDFHYNPSKQDKQKS